ncbi:hypothetical protein D3C78_1189000 [compost metagenome]
MVAEFEFQALGHFALDRHPGDVLRRLLWPPVACGNAVACRQFGGPGQAQVTLDRPVTLGILADDALHRLAIDADQPSRYHRVQRRRLSGEVDQAIGEGLLVGRQDIEREVVGGVLRQLVLPGVQQLATQQGDECHRQQDQSEGQGLACRRQRVAQQLTQAQAPGQRCAGQQATQAFEHQ